MTPGPDMGALLKQIYEKQLDGEIKTTEEGIVLASQMVCLEADLPNRCPHRNDANDDKIPRSILCVAASPR